MTTLWSMQSWSERIASASGMLLMLTPYTLIKRGENCSINTTTAAKCQALPHPNPKGHPKRHSKPISAPESPKQTVYYARDVALPKRTSKLDIQTNTYHHVSYVWRAGSLDACLSCKEKNLLRGWPGNSSRRRHLPAKVHPPLGRLSSCCRSSTVDGAEKCYLGFWSSSILSVALAG